MAVNETLWPSARLIVRVRALASTAVTVPPSILAVTIPFRVFSVRSPWTIRLPRRPSRGLACAWADVVAVGVGLPESDCPKAAAAIAIVPTNARAIVVFQYHFMSSLLVCPA